MLCDLKPYSLYFPHVQGNYLKLDETGAVIEMVKWSVLLKIIFSIILQPHKKVPEMQWSTMLTRKHIVRFQWSKKAASLFSISCMEIESIVKFSTSNVLQFLRIREFCHNFNIGNFMNRGISVVFECLIFHIPWNLGQVKIPETSRIMEFHRILHNRIFTFCERLEYILA